ncbi:MAG TPA: hypothetical protein VJU61_03075, partial [Polyangiaceae bacterium]|nr:hypothetical protein [Polyangiaceae bacterium]
LCIALFALGRSAHAQAARDGSAATRRYSPLETERIRRALARTGGVVDPHPEGKRVESIEIVALDIFEEEDDFPLFLNWFHVTTRHHVIEREVLLRVGSVYDQGLSDETERNLRSSLLFSVVVALPLRGKQADTVRYLVVTKDLWSLRIGWNGQFNKGTIDSLSLQPTERNLFGTGRQLFGTLIFTPRTYTLGLGFVEPRLADSRIRLVASAQAVLSCDESEVLGSSGSFQYSLPLYSRQARWGYSTSVGWSNGRAPLFGTGIAGKMICSVNTSDMWGERLRNGKLVQLPNEYLYDSQSFNQTFTRSFGYSYKTNLSFGIEAARAAYAATNLSGIRAAPEQVDLTPDERQVLESYYLRRLPPGSRRISPFFQIQSFTTDFHRDINAETLALQEDVDFRLGHIASLRVYPALEALGSSRNLLGVQASASYATSVDTGYLKGSASHSVELSNPDQTDALLSLALRFNSPRFALGRFIYDVRVVDHYLNYRNSSQALGGTDRLRGYRAAAVVGANAFVANLEFRTRPLQIFSTQLAAALFHDVGDAFDRWGDLQPLQGVGAGIRFLAPQLDRDVFRIDVGIPIPADAPGGETTVIATFGQAFGVP